MPRLFGRQFSRQELEQKLGRIQQVGGVQPLTLSEGPENGTRAFHLRTGTGLEITIAADRALDVPAASWQGRSLCWQSQAGATHPSFYDPHGLGWLRSFPGGLLTTCGLTWYGAPHTDPEAEVEGPELGLHGRISHIPAREVSYGGSWEGDEYTMFVEGRMVEWMLHGPHLELRRRIWARLGENKLHLRDVVTNGHAHPQEHMILYHCNPGFPLVDAGARYLFPSKRVVAQVPVGMPRLAQWDEVLPPEPQAPEGVYYHDLAADAEGQTVVGLVNRVTDPGQPLGLSIRYSHEMLPWLVQWKNTVMGNYTTGIEPGTNWGDGRPGERAADRMIVLGPGESRTYELEFSVLTTEEEIAGLEAEVKALTGGKPAELAKEPAKSG